MIKKLILVALCGGLSVSLNSCGKSKDSTTGKDSSPGTSVSASKGVGEDLAKKILATYDEAVAEVAKAANPKPESAVLTPQIEKIITTYTAKMAALNTEMLALKAKDVAAFGAANSYMGSNRGKHVAKADTTLTVPIKYYNLDKGDKAMVEMLTTKLVAMIDVAVKQ